MSRAPLSTRQRIIEAAEHLAATQGAKGVSMEAVAEQAGLSKGGLLYHFPTKAALMTALVQNHVDSFEARLSAVDMSRPNALLLALLEDFEQEIARKQPATGLLAAVMEDPDILTPVAGCNGRMLAKLREGSTDPLLAELVFRSLGGLRAGWLLGIESPGNDAVRGMLAHLRQRLS